MRKVLLFLVVLSLGMAVLWYFDKRQRERTPADGAPGVERPGDERPGDEPLEPADEPAEELLQQSGEQGIEFVIGGRNTIEAFDVTGPKEYTFSADLKHTGDGWYDANELTIEFYDLETGVVRETVYAERGRVRVEPDEAGRLVIGDDGKVELFDVEVVQHEGGPVVPLTIRAAHVSAQIERQNFRSIGDDPVSVTGPGLDASGRQLVLMGQQGRFELQQGGTLRFSPAGGGVMTFESTGGFPLVIERVGPEADGQLEISAPQGAILRNSGEAAGEVEADSMVVFGHTGENGEMILDRADASGNVIARRDTDRFTGASAAVKFDELGELRTILLEGQPAWLVHLENDAGELVAVEGGGEGPLNADLTGPLRFDLASAGFLSAPTMGIRIEAQESLSGSLDQLTNEGSFLAKGDVVITQADNRLETQELKAVMYGQDAELVRLECVGLTKLFARDQSADFKVEARDSLVLEARQQEWHLIEARDVTIDAAGERPTRVEIGLLRDLDWTARTFTAEDGVVYSAGLGSGRAQRAIGRGVDDLELYGVPGSPAMFELTEADGELQSGTFEALQIDVTPEALFARRAVSVVLGTDERRIHLNSTGAQLALEEEGGDGRTPFTLLANTVSELKIEQAGQSTVLSCDDLFVSGTMVQGAAPGVENRLQASSVMASGSVVLQHDGALRVAGSGELLEIDARGRGVLSTEAGRKVSAWGVLPESNLPYQMTADWIAFSREELEAQEPLISVSATMLPISSQGILGEGVTEARAERLQADAEGLMLTGNAYVRGTDNAGRDMSIEAGTLRMMGLDPTLDASERSFDSVAAWNGFVAYYEGNVEARGDYMFASQERLQMEGEPAQLHVMDMTLESLRIDADLENFTVSADRGIIRAGEDQGAWSLAFTSIRPYPSGNEYVMAVRAPVYTIGRSNARADGMVIWVDAKAWRELGQRSLWGKEVTEEVARPPVTPPMPEKDLLPNVFRDLGNQRFSKYVNGVYMEGNIEVEELGERSARLGRVYFDVPAAKGWMEDAEIVYKLGFGKESAQVRTRATELHTASDGTVRADRATLTACDHEVPHYVVEVGDMVLDPRGGGGWRISTSGNRLAFRGGFRLPLPPFKNVVLNEKGSFIGFEDGSGGVVGMQNVGVSDSARFGTSVSTSFRQDLGRAGNWIARAFGFDEDNLRGNWDVDAHFLGSRGFLFGLGLRLSESVPSPGQDERFWLDMFGSGIPDSDEDKGFIRYRQPGDPQEFRGWYRARGRYPIKPGEWLDLAFTTQTDPGVQSEFYEGEFQRYEERDNYLHWRKASGLNYFDGKVQIRVDDYRSELEELPSLGAYHGAGEALRLGSVPVLYRGSVDADILRARQGDPNYGEIVFDPSVVDVKVIRADTRHRLEAPVSLGDVRTTPFVSAELTAWDRGVIETESPTRAGLFAGVEFSTTLLKVQANGFIHDITPSLAVRKDLLVDADEEPLRLTPLDDPIDGTEATVGLRSRWSRPGDRRKLDLDARARKRFDRDGGLPDQLTVEGIGALQSQLGSVPFGVRYNALYDLESEDTLYSRFAVGFQPHDDLILEVAHGSSHGRLGSLLYRRIYEAVGGALRFTLDEKWEFELRQTISAQNDGPLDSRLILRRFAHDFVLEILVGYREGEGESIGISFNPVVCWVSKRLGVLDDV